MTGKTQVKVGIISFGMVMLVLAITLIYSACTTIDAKQKQKDWEDIGRMTVVKEYENEWGKFLVFRSHQCIAVIQVMTRK